MAELKDLVEKFDNRYMIRPETVVLKIVNDNGEDAGTIGLRATNSDLSLEYLLSHNDRDLQERAKEAGVNVIPPMIRRRRKKR